MTEFIKADVVVLDYNDLVAEVDLTAEIEKAYGNEGIGLLTVKNVPTLVEKRLALLPLGSKFAKLPQEVKDKYVHADSYFSFGWSHGKENLQGKPDESKGSYYANPQYDRPVDDEELIKQYAPFIHPNIWPKDDLPELESAFKNLGQLIVDVGQLVAKQVDRYIASKCGTYEPNKLHRVVTTSKCCKARLLHYFARSEEQCAAQAVQDNQAADAFSSWCGWHNDHGSLTGLVSAWFSDENMNAVENTDPSAGLYAKSRSSELVKVNIPSNSIAYQIGEATQIHSGGIVQATPHAVRGSSIPHVSRDTFAVFMEPMWMEPMQVPEGVAPSNAQSSVAADNLPKGVPALASRWNNSMDFGQFTAETLKMYY
jgi:isopenicillin N synthase-like dioxygenase